jgi:toxin-antitoxin system PIN domain toxin
MSFAVDVNILLYASDSASRFHEASRKFLSECARADEVFCLAWPTVMAFLRIVTHPGIFERPLSPEEACGNVESLLGRPNVRVLAEQEGFWEAYRRAAEGLSVRGNLVPDAHVAAILLQHGVRRMFTTDADFRKFEFLEPVNPLKQS